MLNEKELQEFGFILTVIECTHLKEVYENY